MENLKSLHELNSLLYKNKFKIIKIKETNKTKENFFKNTFAIFQKVDNMPTSEPDYISYSRGKHTFIGFDENDSIYEIEGKGEISSQYWYTDKGVYRLSDHWKQSASCFWGLSDDNSFEKLEENIDLSNYYGYGEYEEGVLGFCSWNDFFDIKEVNTSDFEVGCCYLVNEFRSVFFDQRGEDLKKRHWWKDYENDLDFDYVRVPLSLYHSKHSSDTFSIINGLIIEKF